MVSAKSIAAAGGGSYARYLESRTVEPERGDYYLTPGAEPTQAPGRWHADAATLEQLGISAGEPVDGHDFVALMEGRHPESGRWLRPEGAGGGRGGGIDVTFSAPKSVSVAWALADPWQREQIEQAHSAAVEQSLVYLRDDIPTVRRRRGGLVHEETARDLLAAEYRHTTARGVGGEQAPDPQLHSHVVIPGVVRGDGRLVAVASRPIFRAKRELGGFYRSALAHELQQSGLVIRGQTGREGRFFEIEGVPAALIEAFSARSREVARAAERFRARYGREPLPGELRHLKLENRKAKQLTTRGDLDRAWHETGHRRGFGRGAPLQLLGADPPPLEDVSLAERVEERLTGQRATFRPSELRAAVLEQSTGELTPRQALEEARRMVRERRVLPLEGDRMTTLTQRAREQAIERRIDLLRGDLGKAVGLHAREDALGQVAERVGAPVTAEQRRAVEVLTGAERIAVLIGPAGTGKGVVIDAAARAEQYAGRLTLGIAVSGSTAEQLGQSSPALEGQTLTLDALLARQQRGSIRVDALTTVYLDEAGMIDTKRLDRLTEMVARSGAKLTLVGDAQQLPSIGAGGMFEHLTKRGPTAQLAEVHRTRDPEERCAWGWLRDGQPEKAMAHYHSKGRLHLSDTREQTCEAAVQRWAAATTSKDPRHVALITDASNHEVDRLNARAQQLRAQRGELGQRELPLRSVAYGLREGDRVAFIEQHRPDRQRRVENGSRGEVTAISPREVTVTIDGSERRVNLGREDAEKLRLGYARHIHREQGATVEQAIVITGGWQTSKEGAYVEATRARDATDWFIAREDLGAEGCDPERITRLAQHMRASRAQIPTLHYRDAAPLGPDIHRHRPLRPRALAFLAPGRHHNPSHDRGR